MEISQAVEFLNWYERMLGLLGVWPLNPQDTRFTLVTSYLIIHVSLEYVDLIQFLNDLDHVVANLTQSTTFTVIVLKVILLRWKNRELGIVIDAVNEDFHVANYTTPKEIRIFLASYEKARKIVRIMIPLVFFTAISMYVAPLIDLVENRNTNVTIKMNLPYYTYMFYDVTEVRAYTFTYLAQLPFVFIGSIGYIGSDYLLVTLMLHICGQLSVLVERIDNLSTDHRECGPAIEKLVKMHIRLISMTTTLEEAYSPVLLAQVLGGMLMICILSYHLLVNMNEGQGLISADFFEFLSYISGVVLLLYIYCYVGESLVAASTRVHRAFSECGWEDMPARHAKSIIICLARSQQPFGLSAGKFYTLSLSSFTDMMRTSMAYFSVLRSLLL